jgi:hypothetical protein
VLAKRYQAERLKAGRHTFDLGVLMEWGVWMVELSSRVLIGMP